MNSNQLYFWVVVSCGICLIGYLLVLRKNRNLQSLEKEKDLIRKYGTCGINYFAHIKCRGNLLVQIDQEDKVIDVSRTTDWKSSELVGKYGDITHCDVCKKEFLADDDDGFISYWSTSKRELELWQEIQQE